MRKLKLLKGALYTSIVITILLGITYIFKKIIIYAFIGKTFENAASIGIIGGSDGPTAIYIATKMSWLSLERLILIFGLITVMLFLFNRAIKIK